MPRGSEQYMPPPMPPNESERLEELHALRILDTAAEERFDRYTRLIADLFDFPVVLVSLVDRDRQWFKAAEGLEDSEWPREISFCGHAILERGVFIVPDARKDRRFKGNPSVTGEPYIRFYAGVSVHGPTGHPVGTLCVIDHEPREFPQRECRRLQQFAALVERELQHSCELASLRSSIEFKAFYDPLTHLPNKRLLCDRLVTLVQDREREPQGGNLAVVIFNLGGLRYVNQAFGASVGDELLKEVGARLASCAPQGAHAARLGGDEFVVVIPARDAEACDAMLQPLRRELVRAYHIGGREHFLDFRVGVSVYPEHGRTPVSLLEKAASAIRARDTRGTVQLQTYSQAHALKVSERLHMESRLRRALDEGNFHMHYQPITALATNRLFAVEALLRWEDPEVEDTSPSRFIPVAENAGLISPIGEWTVREVCRQLEQWRRAHDDWAIPVTLNVSAVQLQQHDFARAVLDQLGLRELSTELLQIEVTEFSLVLDTHLVRKNLESLNESGVKVLIDDFGTGYCSLEYLRRMPVWALKIDRTFVNGLPVDRHDLAITETIIAMAKSLGLKTVGEGIERLEQLELLREKGCDYAQGFLLCRPTTPDSIPDLAAKALTPGD